MSPHLPTLLAAVRGRQGRRGKSDPAVGKFRGRNEEFFAAVLPSTLQTRVNTNIQHIYDRLDKS